MNDSPSAEPKSITAALLVIGDEILSGRTKDKNIGYIADYLTAVGIELREVRVVPDVEAEIIAAVDALRRRYTYLFTTGGIGPTHDDITSESVAKALGREVVEDPRAIALLLERLKPEDLNEARRRMARLPVGAELVQNSVSKAPGFKVENVVVMAGVPRIMQAMLDDIVPRLETGTKILMETIEATGVPEGAYAAGLAEIAEAHPQLSIGSYPSLGDGRFRNEIVVRGKNATEVAAAVAMIYAMLDRVRVERASTRP
jgi:molybdenum cofactor synthesis domain-containing protein